MASYNHVVLLGNATRNPEISYTPQGTAMAAFSLALNRTYTVNGQKKEDVDFFDIQLWGKVAEVAEKYLKKGQPVLIAGRLSQDVWEDKNTHEKKSRVRVVGETMQLLGSKSEGAPPSTTARTKPAPDFSKPPRDPDLDSEPDDQIPY
jgi:single-strand DNA-binding protein